MGAEGFIYELIIMMEVNMKKYNIYYCISLFFLTSEIVLILWGKPNTLSIYIKAIEVIKIQW